MDAHYGKLAINLLISAVIMFLVMYTMIDRIDHFYPNLNQFYMTMMMVAPMAILMLFIMRSMYQNTNLNYVLYAAFAGIFAISFWAMRTQAAVGNEQFLRSMIPHHSGAILMCRQSRITDPQIVALCGEVVRSQQEEISEMQRILTRY